MATGTKSDRKIIHENGTANGKASPGKANVTIAAPSLSIAEFTIRGTAPLVMNKFSAKAKQQIHDKHVAGSTSKSKRGKESKDFKELYQQAMHISEEGWYGIPASAFRAACISACRLVGYKMTMAKMSIFVESDGFDRDEWTPLVRITKGEPEYLEMHTRNATGVIDLRPRPMWRPGWEAKVRIRFDTDQFTLKDVANLLSRVGSQVGLLEGRPDSKNSTGMGWGLFDLVGNE